MNPAREAEYAKYDAAYRRDSYRMGQERYRRVQAVLRDLPFRGTLLDVGTGRGETLDIAEALGYDAQGTEVVEYLLTDRVRYAEAHALPFDDDAFELVTCFDVLEHLVPQDTQQVLHELRRVARRALILSIGAYSHQENGVEYHINARTPEGWRFMIQATYGDSATLLQDGNNQWWAVKP